MHRARQTRLVLIVLIIVAIALITFDFRDGGESSAHSAGGRVFGPVERLAGDIASPFVGFFHATTGDDAGEIASLQRQNDQLRAEVSADQLGRQDEAQLKKLLAYNVKTAYHIVPATVIAAGGDYADTVTINEGTRSGIKIDETVLNGDGLVGVVTGVSADTATVDLASDADLTIGVRMAGTNEIGAVTGSGTTMAGTSELKLTLFSGHAVLRPGQQVVTFGSVGGRPYVPDVPVGKVTSVTSQPGSLTQAALIEPYVDFTGLGVVGVVTGSAHG